MGGREEGGRERAREEAMICYAGRKSVSGGREGCGREG